MNKSEYEENCDGREWGFKTHKNGQRANERKGGKGSEMKEGTNQQRV